MRPIFEMYARDPGSSARAGTILTSHGSIETPAFAPVGTHGTVKTLAPRDLVDLGVEVVMSNAYHLEVRPGSQSIQALGGLHAFSGWNGPLMTDSGGFQVFSLSTLSEIDDAGVTFRAPLDGSPRRFTPESVIAVQERLGADLIFPLDVCTPYPATRDGAAGDAQRTLAWARQARDAHQRTDQLLYGIVQGGTFPDLRRQSAREIASLAFDAYAIGGVSVGEGKTEMMHAVEACVAELPETAPRHLLGVGYPEDIVEGVARGMDTFDCVMPTRVARTGAALTMEGRLNLRNAEFARDDGPVDAACACYTCTNFSRGAIRHWLKSDEILPLQLLTLHNLHFILKLMRDIRTAIVTGAFDAFRRRFHLEYRGMSSAGEAA